MKEFEKWVLEDECPVLSTDDERQREKGWRAALGLVLGWLDYSAEHKEIEDKIYEELEE